MSLVSVVIPSKDNFDSLLLAIGSVLHQSHTNFEIIIVNQNSIDLRYYSDQLKSFSNTAVIHLTNDSNTNSFTVQQEVKRIGAKVAKGDWICFLEDTDYWYPQKLEYQLDELSKAPNILLSASSVHIGNGPFSYDKDIKGSFRTTEKTTVFCKSLGHTNYIYSSTVMLHRSISHLLDYWFDLLDHTDCLFISASLVYYSSRM